MKHHEVIAVIRDILDTPPAGRTMMIDRLMMDCRDQVRQITNTICVKMNKVNSHDFDDFQQLTYIELFKLVELCMTDPVQLDSLGNFWAMVFRRAFNSVKSNTFSNAGSMPASGMDNIAKRANAQRRLGDQLRQMYQREPTELEIVTEYNKQIVTRRKDARKQGAIGKVGDMAAVSSSESIDTLPDSIVSTHDVDSAPLASVEVAPLVRKIIEAAREVSEDHGKVAALWIGGFVHSEAADRMDTSDIAERLGLSTSTVRARLRVIREIARDVTGRDFGIDGVEAKIV